MICPNGRRQSVSKSPLSLLVAGLLLVGCNAYTQIPYRHVESARLECIAPDPFSDYPVDEKTQVKLENEWKSFCGDTWEAPKQRDLEIRNYDEWLTLAAIIAVPAATILGGCVLLELEGGFISCF